MFIRFDPNQWSQIRSIYFLLFKHCRQPFQPADVGSQQIFPSTKSIRADAKPRCLSQYTRCSPLVPFLSLVTRFYTTISSRDWIYSCSTQMSSEYLRLFKVCIGLWFVIANMAESPDLDEGLYTVLRNCVVLVSILHSHSMSV